MTIQPSIRTMTQHDIPTIVKLIQETFLADEHEFYLDYYPIAMRFPSVVAELEHRIIGVAARYLSTLHPQWLRAMVAVDKPFRRQGIGTKLHEAALKARTLDETIYGLQGNCYIEETEAETFMTALGYKLRLDCHILELDLKQFNARPVLPLYQQHLKILPFTELLETTAMKHRLFDFLVMRYIEEHAWSLPQSKDYPDWHDIVFDKVRQELSFALLDEETLVAASSVINETPEILDMCWAYSALEFGQEQAASFLKYLLAHQFRVALQLGLNKASLEVDSSDLVYSSLLEWLPIQNDKIWRILQKPLG
jgi:GNAT superfamily N-acetyltransferase